MNLSERNTIESALLIYIDVDSFHKNEKLENGFEEFYSLVKSSGLVIKESTRFKQKAPITSTFMLLVTTSCKLLTNQDTHLCFKMALSQMSWNRYRVGKTGNRGIGLNKQHRL